ncbi:MAG: hypothetical protein AMXMBFR84_31660 [Candidatus Hydrogenedentota bacterium]
MKYVDGYILPVTAKNVDAYRKIARMAGKIWMEHGALQYCESAGDDLYPKKLVAFPKMTKLKKGETVIFAWIVFKSKSHRDKVNAKVMKDPRMNKVDPNTMPFDWRRIAFGGFNVIVDF